MDPERLRELYRRVRRSTERLCQTLAVEDYVVQTMPDVSPTKWHLGHTTWFFEEFVLRQARRGYQPVDERYRFLFNSYYDSVGARQPRPERGFLSRPTVDAVFEYRHQVDARMEELFADAPAVIELGINHEEQHQELMLTDLKHVFATNPLRPVYRASPDRGGERASRERGRVDAAPAGFVAYGGGLVEIGDGGGGFAFDNERPRHRVYLQPFELGRRLVTCGEYRGFIDAGGYLEPRLWLSDGWEARERGGWQAPLYWEPGDGDWRIMTLAGLRALDPAEPACHVSFYEADAFARWAGARLPAEAEWEHSAAAAPPGGNFLDGGELHPRPAAGGPELTQLFGDVWEWTSSGYLPYPGYVALPGALGEYNGKFMCNRLVLRGGSCLTPARHIRASYRNFFPPDARWQASGIRLAR